jgi:hypothetical protein
MDDVISLESFSGEEIFEELKNDKKAPIKSQSHYIGGFMA